MSDLEYQRIIEKSPLYTLLWEWMNDLRPEEAENPGDGYAFTATNGREGPTRSAFGYTLYEQEMKANFKRFGPLPSNCYFRAVGIGMTFNLGRPYYYRYAIEYALLYMDDEERRIQQPLYDDLAQRMKRIHPRAFADLELRLGMFRYPGRYAAEFQRLRNELAERSAPPLPPPVVELQPADAYAQSLTRQNCVHYIATRRNEDRAEACIEMLEALLPKDEHESLREDIDQERIDCEQRKQMRRNNAQSNPAASVQYHVSGDLVMDKHVDHEVGYVAAGATGIALPSRLSSPEEPPHPPTRR